MSLKEFIIEWRQFGPRVAINNALLVFVMDFIGAKSYTIEYEEREEMPESLKAIQMR